jgi:hypothetical protein
MPAGLRLADLLAGVSLASDLGLGLPPEDAVRSCLVGIALGRALELDETDVADVFYVSLLQHIGCTGYAHETYLVWHDDIAANRAASERTSRRRSIYSGPTFRPSGLLEQLGVAAQPAHASGTLVVD